MTPDTDQFGSASPWRRVKVGAIIFGVVLVIGVGLIMFGGGGASEKGGERSSPTPATPESASHAGGSGPGDKATSVENGVPVGYPHSKTGAAAAAVNYQMARSSPSYFTDEALRHQVLQVIMTSSSLPGQQRQDDKTAKGLMVSLGVTADSEADLVMRAAPLGTSVTSYSDDTATVQVWMSELVGVPAEESKMPVVGTWSTYTVILQWQDGDWKVATMDQADGPTPLIAPDQSPSSTSDMRAANEKFEAPRYGG